MNRVFWGIIFLVLAAGGWAQSTWRGQAEVWTAGEVPAEGYVAASNEFPRNSLLSVENYKTKKTIQVRVVASLPPGSSALILLNPKAAAALDIKTGEIPLVGVRIDPAGVDRPDNPDPDINPLAQRPVASMSQPVEAGVAKVTPPAPAPASAPVPLETPTPMKVEPPQPTLVRTPMVTSLEVAQGSTALDPDLMPLPALEEPELVPEPEVIAEPTPVTEESRTPLAVAEDPEPATPVTPGKRVFVTTRDPEPVAVEVPTVTEPVPEAEPEVVAEPVPDPEVVAEPVPEPVVEPEPVLVETAPPAEIPVEQPVEEPVTPPPVVVEAPEPAEVPPPAVVVTPSPSATVAPASVIPPVPAASWVTVPGKLEGPVLGQVPILKGLEKGRSYVQVGAWATEAELLAALDAIKSYVPLALYKAEGQKNPWRMVVPAAPKGQLGVLLMHYRSQGFKTAAMVKG